MMALSAHQDIARQFKESVSSKEMEIPARYLGAGMMLIRRRMPLHAVACFIARTLANLLEPSPAY